jgi:hypothetical protein
MDLRMPKSEPTDKLCTWCMDVSRWQGSCMDDHRLQLHFAERAVDSTVCVFDRKVHLRMLLVPTPARLKLLQACDQWHSSLVSTFLTG